MSKYLISAKNPSTDETSEFAVRANSEAEARENAHLEDGWEIVSVEAIEGE